MTKKSPKEFPMENPSDKGLNFDKVISDALEKGDEKIEEIESKIPIKSTVNKDIYNLKMIQSSDEVFILDGQRLVLQSPDLDGDGIVGGTETIQRRYRNESDIVQPTELGETLKELNKDIVEEDSRMSSIDLKARLSTAEVGAILAYDTLIAMKFLPKDALFLTRQRKRLSVSEGGQGRKETVDIVRGVKDEKSGTSFGDRIAGMFSSKPK